MTLADELAQARRLRHGSSAYETLSAATVGIAGLGGLGSHIAIALTRMGIGRLVLVDYDRVDVSNLHRQNYGIKDIGQSKTAATARILHEVEPRVSLTLHQKRLTPENAAQCFATCDILCEAFDNPEEKAMLVETVLGENNDIVVIAGSGMAGIASGNQIKTRRLLSRLYVVGDGKSDVASDGHLYAARVALCANQQALMATRLLLGQREP